MGKRDDARRDAAFARGDVGVDGAATEERKNAAELERDKAREGLLRGRTYLGREFLTWLLWRSESGDPLLEWEGAALIAVFQTRLSLRGVHGDVTELSVKGTLSPYSEQVRFALSRGLLVHQARLRLEHGDKTYEATLDAEFLDVRSAKLPELMSEEEDDRASERLSLAEELSGMLEALVGAFLEVRATPAWRRRVVPAMRRWMAGAGVQSDTEVPSTPALPAPKPSKINGARGAAHS
ncbi:MAG TPA: hypothetical protein VEY30_01770 [Myxococcaceae bacterium]|nr:hypothetical protein [Myxococcaceae bacterium]